MPQKHSVVRNVGAVLSSECNKPFLWNAITSRF